MRIKFNVSLLIVLLLQTVFAFSQALTPNTTGSFVYIPLGPLSTKPVTVFYHIPNGNINTMPILFSFHGDERNASDYRDFWISMANANGFMVFAPEFKEVNYPGGDGYQLGNVFIDGDNPSLATLNPTNQWTFSVADPLFESIKTAVSGTQQTYDAWGHSGGAQFLQRFRLYLPNSKLSTAICSNAGWYTVPESTVDFPYGINRGQLSNTNLNLAFPKKLIVHLGLNDIDPNSLGLRHNTTVDNQQGLHRLGRGRYFYNKSLIIAQTLNASYNWQRVEVAGVGHEPQLMANNALQYLFQTATTTNSSSIIDGGFENQSIGNIQAGSASELNLSTTSWSANTTASAAITRVILASGGRSGPQCASFGSLSTTLKTFYTPQIAGAFASNTTYQMQFYYKPTTATATLASSSVDVYTDNNSATTIPAGIKQSVAAGLSASANASNWTKVAVQILTNNTATSNFGVAAIAFTTAASSSNFTASFDDFVVYQANTADTTAPNSPGAITVTGAASGGANVSWGAASGGVDGGGYVVVRYITTLPSASDDLLQNGIYKVGNTVGAGVVRYTGNSNSFTDSGLNPIVDYYYKVYTVDKAFNYSNESITITPTQSLATTYYFKGTTGTGDLKILSNWGLNTDGTGAAPADFTAAGQVFEIRNTTAVALDGTWDVGISPANGTKVRLGNNTQLAVTLTLNLGASIGPSGTGNFDVIDPSSGNQIVIYKGTAAISFGNIFDNNLEVIYDDVTQSSSSTKNFGTISIINGANVTFSATPIITNINVDATSTLVAPNNASTYITIPSGGSVVINGTVRIPKLTGFVSSNVVTPGATFGDFQFIAAENLTLGTNSTVEYARDAVGAQIVTARTDYKNLSLGGTAPKTITGSVSTTSLIVASASALTVNSGSNLSVTEAIVNSGTITIENNANLIQINNVANTGVGNTVIKRNTNPLFRLDYTMWSSPVNGTQTVSDFSPLTSNGCFYEYNPTTNVYNVVANATPFSQGKGFLIRMPNEDPSNLGAASQYVLGNTTLTYNGSFSGVPNNGNVSIAGEEGQFVAVGNPYPSNISANAFIDANLDGTTGGTLYFWKKTNNVVGTAYATYNKLGGTITPTPGSGGITPNGVIAVGQGFITKVPAIGSINFTNAMRNTSSASFLRTSTVSQPDRIWINLTEGVNPVNQMLVGYMDGATNGVDAALDGKYINDDATALTSDILGGEYTIQGRPAFNISDIVNLNFKSAYAGTFNIAIDHTDGAFANGQAIYLTDNTTGQVTNLQTDTYTFTAPAAVNNVRFSLKYQNVLNVNAPVFNENSVKIYTVNGTIMVNAGANSINNIKVYDIQGRLLTEQKAVNASLASIQNLGASQQVLIVKVTGADNSVVIKKVVN